jgi:DNA-binding response OmpR family regulator
MTMGKKVLLIEDSPTVLGMIQSAIEDEGYETISAIDGQEGIKKAEEEKPDLVIIDTILPDINGFVVCEKIRTLYGRETPKIIVMTGAFAAIDAEKARIAGADDYCAKTSDISNIVEAAKALV